MITLFGETHWESPFVMTVFVALKEKGLAFEEQELDLQAGEQRSGDFPARSLTARVPALDVDGFVLSESLAIVEYLEERFPPPEYARVLPAEREERARARQVLGWLRSDLGALRRERPTTSILFAPAQHPLPPDAQADAGKLIRVAGQLLSGPRGFLFDRWSIADADLTLALMRLIASGDPVPPALTEYAARQWARPSVRAFAEHPRKSR
jgi:glutathione S-transferase